MMKNLIPAFICLFLAISCQAEIIYIDDDADVGGDGQTWGTAYKYLQDALAELFLVYNSIGGNDEKTINPCISNYCNNHITCFIGTG